MPTALLRRPNTGFCPRGVHRIIHPLSVPLRSHPRLVSAWPSSPRSISGLKLKADYAADKFILNSTTTPKGVDLGAVYAHGQYLVGGAAGVTMAGALSNTAFGFAYSQGDIKLSSTM